MAQYEAKLTEGAKALHEDLPDLPHRRLHDAPHRRVPEVRRSTTPLANATRAKTTNDGRSMQGAHAGFPFPIPQNGYEAMWNHLVRFNGQAYEAKYRNLNVDASGRPTLATEGISVQEYPFWDDSQDRAPRPTGASSSPTPGRRAAPAKRC